MRQNEKPCAGLPSSAGRVIRNKLKVADTSDYTDLQQSASTDITTDITGAQALDIIRSTGDDAPVTPAAACAQAQAAIEDEHWDRPQQLAEKPLVASFEYSLLPSVLQGFVSDIATHMQCPADYVAAPLIVALSSVCAPVALVQPKAGWRVTMNVWGAAVGRPGMMKSPAIDAALAPLHALQRAAFEEHERALHDYQTEAALHDAAAKAARAEAEKLARSNPERARELFAAALVQHEAPALRRFIVNDATQEALGLIMKSSPCALYADDELIAILRACDKQGQENLRAFLLKCYDADKSHTWDRIGRGTVHVEKCALAIFGGIQPAKLASYVYDAINGGRGDDGLLQRFGLLVYPDVSADFLDIEAEMDEEARATVESIFQRIAALQTDVQRILHLSFDAKEVFKEWRMLLEIELRAGKLSPALESHLAKYRKLVPALAGIFALVENQHCAQIELRHIQLAIAWSKYLRSHAERVYFEQTEAAALVAARNLLQHLENGDLDLSSGILSVRLLARKEWRGMGKDYEKIRRACAVLCDHWYLRVAAYDSNNRIASYSVHPHLRYTHAMRELDRLREYKSEALH